MRRLRSFVIALAVLALSAGIAFAARQMPQQAAGGLEKAADAANKTVPVGPPTVESEDEPDGEAEEEAEEEAEAPDEEAEAGEHPDNHGATVSEAAEGETPEGWANHGAYVSAVAHGDAEPGDVAPEEAVANGGRMPKAEKPAQAERGAKPEKAAKPKP